MLVNLFTNKSHHAKLFIRSLIFEEIEKILDFQTHIWHIQIYLFPDYLVSASIINCTLLTHRDVPRPRVTRVPDGPGPAVRPPFAVAFGHAPFVCPSIREERRPDRETREGESALTTDTDIMGRSSCATNHERNHHLWVDVGYNSRSHTTPSHLYWQNEMAVGPWPGPGRRVYIRAAAHQRRAHSQEHLSTPSDIEKSLKAIAS